MSKPRDKSSLDLNSIEKWEQFFDKIDRIVEGVVKHRMDRLEKVELERDKTLYELWHEAEESVKKL